MDQIYVPTLSLSRLPLLVFVALLLGSNWPSDAWTVLGDEDPII